ncbi:dihydroorotate dehydrogenase [candidate division KSB1 bacterium]|nr:dihydroorotate dehydrogenase [candidate division KSB1 bacterium]
MRRRWSYLVDLSVKIGKLVLKNPIIPASGTFGYGEECAELIDLNSLGGLVTKAITLHPRAGNPPPRIAETPAGMLNSIGLANVGVERFIREKLLFLNQFNTVILVNVAGSSIEEYIAVVERLESAGGIDGYEINISCPNVKQGGMAFGTVEQSAYELTRSIRKLTARTVIVKLTPNVTEIGNIACAVEDAGADAVSLINTIRAMAIDIQTRKPRIATTYGGLSGPAIKPIALAKVLETYQRVKIPIIGMGGIMNGEDIIEFMLAGATAIQIGTVNFVAPRACFDMLQALENYCIANRISRISQLTGQLEVV